MIGNWKNTQKDNYTEYFNIYGGSGQAVQVDAPTLIIKRIGGFYEEIPNPIPSMEFNAWEYPGVPISTTVYHNEENTWDGETWLVTCNKTIPLKPPKDHWEGCAGIILPDIYYPCGGCSANVSSGYFSGTIYKEDDGPDPYIVSDGYSAAPYVDGLGYNVWLGSA